MVQGFDYARAQGAHVLSMSMGGLSSEALVDAVNLAYDAGLVLVTAAGNNYAGVPSPKSIVFPARLHRVLAACGVMADGRPYAGLKFRTMQGNFGPANKMETALGAYTPNVPWAQIDCGKVVHDGRRRNVFGHPADRGRGGAVACGAQGCGQPLLATLDAGRGGAARSVHFGGEVDRQDDCHRDAGEGRAGCP